MRHIIALLALLGLAAVIPSATAGTKKIGTINGLDIYRIKTAGLFAPSSTTIVAADPNKPGTVEGVLNSVGGPGFVPACATAGGIVGGAAVLRPARTKVSTSASPTTTVNSGPGSVTTTVNDAGSHNHHNN
jgi:hypothetical protein